MQSKVLIGGFQKSSLIDFKGRIAAVVFLQGCNFSCPYCHNPELVRPMTIEPVKLSYITDFLNTRKGKLDGVVITGGEPTLHEGLPYLIETIRNLGFEIKLDTNGSNPDITKSLVNEGLVDYVAMDIKTSFENYQKVTIRNVDVEKIKQTAEFLINGDVEYEFRTTVVDKLLCYDDFVQINDFFKSFAPKKIKSYYLQKFQPSKHINEDYKNAKTFEDEEFEKVVCLFNDTVEFVAVR